MKILFITEFFPSSKYLKFTGGIEARTYYLVKDLKKRHQVFIISRKAKQSRIEASFFSVFERIFFIFKVIIKGLNIDFDIVEGSNFTTYLPAFILSRIKNKPAVSWWPDVFKGRWISFFGITGLFGEIIERISLKLPWNQVIALSYSTKDKLIKNKIPEDKIEVVYGGIDLKSINSIKQKKNLKTKNILCISRLVKYKRIKDLINAFVKLQKQYPSLSLTIVGQGPEEKKLKDLVENLNLLNKINFLKNIPRNKLIRLLKQAYIFCLPSVVEGFGLVTIEAASCQTPYIITDIKVNKEITNNGQGGLFFKKRDKDDLKEKLAVLLKDKNLYKENQKQGLILAKKYQWQKIASQTEKVYSKTLKVY